MAVVLLPGGSDVAGKAVKVILPLVGQLCFQPGKLCIGQYHIVVSPVKIAATDGEKAKHAIRRIEEITAEIEVGRVYTGKVTRIVDFGAFVAIGGGKEGLVHISQIADKRVEKVTDYLQMGQEVPVKVLEVDRQGRIRLSIKEATEQSQPAAAPEAPAAEQGE